MTIFLYYNIHFSLFIQVSLWNLIIPIILYTRSHERVRINTISLVFMSAGRDDLPAERLVVDVTHKNRTGFLVYFLSRVCIYMCSVYAIFLLYFSLYRTRLCSYFLYFFPHSATWRQSKPDKNVFWDIDCVQLLPEHKYIYMFVGWIFKSPIQF